MVWRFTYPIEDAEWHQLFEQCKRGWPIHVGPQVQEKMIERDEITDQVWGWEILTFQAHKVQVLLHWKVHLLQKPFQKQQLEVAMDDRTTLLTSKHAVHDESIHSWNAGPTLYRKGFRVEHIYHHEHSIWVVGTMKMSRHLLFLRAWRHKSGDELSSSVHIERVGICEARSIAEKKQTMMGVPTIAKATLFRKRQECADLMYLSAVRCVIICTLLFSPTTIHAAPPPSQMQTTIDRLRQEKDELQVENNNLNNAVDKLKEDIEEKDKRYHCLLNLERERTDEMVAIRKEVINVKFLALSKSSSVPYDIGVFNCTGYITKVLTGGNTSDSWFLHEQYHVGVVLADPNKKI